MERNLGQPVSRALPSELFPADSAQAIVLVDCADADLRRPDPSTVARVNSALYQAFTMVSPPLTGSQAVLKVHIGEPKCATRMRPEYTEGSARFLRDRGMGGIVAGDTTVAYSGPRGHKQNPLASPQPYRELARRQGWSADGPAAAPFVVLDRPSTAIPGRFEFDVEETRAHLRGRTERFRDCFLAGGFAAADFVVNHAHLTLHGLAGVAGCVKSLAMGCSSLRGKLRMHQSLLPHFDAQRCIACGQCVADCPAHALELADGSPYPAVDCHLCIGCGECEAVCAAGAVGLEGNEIADWQRGQSTFPLRLADYAIGLIASRPNRTVHVLHMYTVTERCDCLNRGQEPILDSDIGFLVGWNPFALDLWAARRLAAALPAGQRAAAAPLLRSAEQIASYVKEAYGIATDGPLETICLE